MQHATGEPGNGRLFDAAKKPTPRSNSTHPKGCTRYGPRTAWLRGVVKGNPGLAPGWRYTNLGKVEV